MLAVGAEAGCGGGRMGRRSGFTRKTMPVPGVRTGSNACPGSTPSFQDMHCTIQQRLSRESQEEMPVPRKQCLSREGEKQCLSREGEC
jgi:hypothetical protein